MPYHIFEIPEGNHYVDIVAANPESPTDLAYTHYCYTIGTTARNNELRSRRGIPFDSFRNWEDLFQRYPELQEQIEKPEEYYPGKSVLESNSLNPKFALATIIRLGALELLANIFSGRVTAGDKDPFPHQLELQQYIKTNQNRVQRLLIADEVGLGKTIEVGLILRDLLIARMPNPIRCLYLTKGRGLMDDVRMKLQSVIPGTVDGQSIVKVENSFTEYGNSDISGIHVASIDAARLYVSDEKKNKLPNNKVSPEIIIIDECHHCSSKDENLTSSEELKKDDTTKTYEAAYQLLTGKFWPNSERPKLAILMSATPFRSKPQFVNLLRLLTHQSAVDNAYSPEVNEEELVNKLKSEESSVAIIWRQQDKVRSWSDELLFPNITIIRPHREGSPLLASPSQEYIDIIEQIRDTVKRIHRSYRRNFGGFATRQLEIRLTSSSIAGACWIFRWCVRHQTWKTLDDYNKDSSNSTKNLRQLLKEISQKLAIVGEKNRSKHADVSFPSDDFVFKASSLPRASNFEDIYRFSEKLHNNDDEDGFNAASEHIFELTQLGLNLLNFTADSTVTGVENAKLNWLKQILDSEPESRFLVFTESLQTCEIITKALPGKSEQFTGKMSSAARNTAVAKFRDLSNNMRVLVATTAADEGFDFQVANRVVHWDLSPSPEVLMQRNGRVARLGQISDVTAYYMIVPGTHEEKRDGALLERFTELGITDEKMILRILGSLSSEEEDKIFDAVQNDDDEVQIIDEILQKAKQDNEQMEEQLSELQKKLDLQQVIDRQKLAERLESWIELGLPRHHQNKFNLTFQAVDWERPVFGEKTTIEPATAKILTIKTKKVIFDPEFNVFGKYKAFGRAADKYLLAGLYPWIKAERDCIVEHRPLKEDGDPIGELAGSLARQRQADFTTISAAILYESVKDLPRGTRYLLFATHPMRELETNLSEIVPRYLTFYAFGEDLQEPLDPEGASATQVYDLISLLEEQAKAFKTQLSPLDSKIQEDARKAGQEITQWLKKSRKTGGLTKKSYFLPIPVALVAVIGEVNSSEAQAEANSEVAEKFSSLAEKWETEVEGMSSTARMSQHPAYQEIIQMGTQIVPLLLQELKRNPLYWLSALEEITGENPIQPEQRGRIKQMAEAWLEWGQERGY